MEYGLENVKLLTALNQETEQASILQPGAVRIWAVKSHPTKQDTQYLDWWKWQTL